MISSQCKRAEEKKLQIKLFRNIEILPLGITKPFILVILEKRWRARFKRNVVPSKQWLARRDKKFQAVRNGTDDLSWRARNVIRGHNAPEHDLSQRSNIFVISHLPGRASTPFLPSSLASRHRCNWFNKESPCVHFCDHAQIGWMVIAALGFRPPVFEIRLDINKITPVYGRPTMIDEINRGPIVTVLRPIRKRVCHLPFL